MEHEDRSFPELKEHYEIEKELAAKLRAAPKDERGALYTSLYDELFRRVPYLTQSHSSDTEMTLADWQMKFLRRFLFTSCSFLEIGPGNCGLSIKAAEIVKNVFALDVSTEITKGIICPGNFQLLITDGVSIPLPHNSIDVVYSNQLMEHLHPEDAYEQLKNIYDVLAKGGVYVCITPNRLNGPHDISKYFDKIASGFHLKEYATFELISLFKSVGFSKIKAYIQVKGKYIQVPSLIITTLEKILNIVPYTVLRIVVQFSLVRVLLGIRLVGKK